MNRLKNHLMVGAVAAATSLIAADAGALDGTIAQNSQWNVTRPGSQETLRIVAYGDSIVAGYIDVSNIARRASTHVAAEYGAALWGQNIEVRRRAQSGAVGAQILSRIQSDRAFMQTPNTIGVHVVMCGNDYLQARSAFAGQSGQCNYNGLATALNNCLSATASAIDFINVNAGPNAKFKVVGNLYYPGFDSDNVLTNCTDPDSGERLNRRDDVFLAIIAESNWETCNLAVENGWVCADNFAEFMASDFDSNGDGVIDTDSIRFVPGEPREDYIARILAANDAGLLRDSNFKRVAPSTTVDYLLSDDTHTTFVGPQAKAGLGGGTPGGNVPVFHATSGAYPNGRNPTWNTNGHDRMGYALATNYNLNVNAGPDVTILACEAFDNTVTFNDRVFFGPWDVWADFGDGNGLSTQTDEMSVGLFNEFTAPGNFTVDVVVEGAYGTIWEDSAAVTVLSAEEAVLQLIADLDALREWGAISRGVWNGNRRPLEMALNMIGNGFVDPAQSMIQDFIDNVSGGSLDAATAQSLIAFASRAQASVACHPNERSNPGRGAGPRPERAPIAQGKVVEEQWMEFNGVRYALDDPALHELMREHAEAYLELLESDGND